MMPRLRKALAWSVLFVGGYNATLPVVDDLVSLPWIFVPIQVAHGVFLRDALLILYVALFAMAGALGRIRLESAERRFAVLIASLGFFGILSTVVNVTTLLDLGEAMRFFLFAAYFAVAVDWARSYGPTFLLRTYLIGIAVGGVVNLYYTYQVQAMVLGILPFLLGQNGPGGFLGISVVLAAWLTLLHRTRWEILIAVAVAAIGIFAASISYSRLAMLQAGCGIVAWVTVIIAAAIRQHTKRRGLVLVTLAAIVIAGLTTTSIGGEYLGSVREFTDRKFRGVDIRDANSVGARYQYFWGVLEIFMANPLLGVGYSGFYDAVVATPTYKSGSMADEGVGLSAQRIANPHNAILYYVSANGVFGLTISMMIVLLFARSVRASLLKHRTEGTIVCACILSAYFVNAMTLPTLFNTEVMYAAAAVAFAERSSASQRRGTVRSLRPTWAAAPASV
jgi:O-antigen ligase